MRLVQANNDVETRYGGRFVQSIDGLEGGGAGGSVDWFYFVNGFEADVGAAEYELVARRRGAVGLPQLARHARRARDRRRLPRAVPATAARASAAPCGWSARTPTRRARP